MSAPPLLCAAAALFWGWQSGHVLAGVLVALLVESPRVVRARLDLATVHVARAFDLGLAALIVLAGALAIRGNVQEAVLEAAAWLPAALLPFVLAHRLGGAAAFDVRALWWRSQRAAAPPMPPMAVDPAWIYAPLCLLAASIAAPRTAVFYAGAAAMSLWMLFPVRSRRVTLAAWAAAALLSVALGYVGQLGLNRMQKLLIETTVDLLGGVETDPYRNATAIGEIGELKFSGEIFVRVSPAAGQAPPRYLHRATYDRYAAGSWYVRDAPLEPTARGGPRGTFALASSGPASSRVTIVTATHGLRAVLPVPLGTTSLDGLDAVAVHRNRLGTVQVRAPASLLRFEAVSDPRAAGAGAPTDQDLAVPASERGYLERWLDAQGLAGRPAGEVARGLAMRFRRDFAYALYQPWEAAGPLPVRTFLERTRAGHCEYFATATVLLLRTAGIPARYATGYVVNEHSPLEDLYVVRARHAHAWARAYLDGAWHELDTTPSTWVAAEGEQASLLQPLMDLLSLVRYRFRTWQAGGADVPLWPVAVAGAVVLLLAGRKLRRRRARDAGAGTAAAPVRPSRGGDSEFLRIVERLCGDGRRRAPDEPVAAWAGRVAGELPPDLRADFEALAALHRRHRFDPRGLGHAEREALTRGVRAWLTRWAARG